MMSFSLLVGFLQVSLAFILRTVNKMLSGNVSDGLSSFSFLMMLVGVLVWAAHVNFLNMGFGSFAINTVQVGTVLLAIPKNVGLGLAYGGIAFFVLFTNKDKPLSARIGQSFLDFYNGATGIFGNILSYLRLFALGLAGSMLAMVFNQMALMLITDAQGVVHYRSPIILASIFLLVFGHALNLALCLVGAFVHPLRLTFVEFLQNIDLSWGGLEYAPLSKVNVENKRR
jgi:V/A-type H+-transporting ATPase subunit I